MSNTSTWTLCVIGTFVLRTNQQSADAAGHKQDGCLDRGALVPVVPVPASGAEASERVEESRKYFVKGVAVSPSRGNTN